MSRRIVVHNHLPSRARDAGRAVSRDEEEHNREAAYRKTGISRDAGSAEWQVDLENDGRRRGVRVQASSEADAKRKAEADNVGYKAESARKIG